jgi:hypothetical protein
MGPSRSTLMGENALEVIAPLQYSTVHVLSSNTKPERIGPRNHGHLFLARPRLREYKMFEQVQGGNEGHIPVGHIHRGWQVP